MKLSKKSNSKLLAGALVGIALVGSAAAIAQVSSTPPAVPAAPPTAVVAPVVPTAPAQNPGAVAAIEQSVLQAPAPAQQAAPVAGPAPAGTSATGYQVPAAGPGIFEGSDQTLREIAYLQTEVALNGKRKERIESMSALKEAERGFVDVLAGKSKDDKAGPGPAGAAAPGATAIPVAVIVKPEAYVNSVYGYGNDMYAEIVIGSTKVLASKGTVLSDGSRVTAISSSSVTLSGKKGTKRLLVRGAAGY